MAKGRRLNRAMPSLVDGRFVYRDEHGGWTDKHMLGCTCRACRLWRRVDERNGSVTAPVMFDGQTMASTSMLASRVEHPSRHVTPGPLTDHGPVDVTISDWWAGRGVTELRLFVCDHGQRIVMPLDWARRCVVYCDALYGQDGLPRGCRWLGRALDGGYLDAAEQAMAWYAAYRAGVPEAS